MAKVNYTANIVIDNLHVRRTPSISGVKIKTLAAGDPVTIIEIDGNWFKHSQGWSLLYVDGVDSVKIIGNNSVVIPPTMIVIPGTNNGRYVTPYSQVLLSEVAFTGNYTDLINTPTEVTETKSGLMSATDKTNLQAILATGAGNGVGFHKVATSGSYNDLTDTPIIVEATISAAGLMSKLDKAKLNGLSVHPITHPSTMITMENGKTLEEFSSTIGGGVLSSPLTVVGVNQGQYSNGNIISAGTSLETIIRNMLSVGSALPVIYTAPTLSMTTSVPVSQEIGTSISPLLTPVFNRNDAGAISSYTLNRNGVSVYSNPSSLAYNEPSFVVGDTAVQFQAVVNYSTGLIKNDTNGTPSPSGSISAGTVTSSIISYIGKRKMFYGTETASKTPSTSADIRALVGSTLGVAKGASFDMTIPTGAKFVCIAYLASLSNIAQIKSVNMDNDVKDVFTKIEIDVTDANGANPIAYNVYYYNPAIAFPSNDTFKVII